MSGTILSGDGWFGKWPSKGLFCWYKNFFFLCTFINFFSRAHIIWNDFMLLFWEEVLISEEIPLRSHVICTQHGLLLTHWCWDWAGNQQQQFGERSFHVRRRLFFDLTPASKSQELNWKVPLFCSALAWSLVSCAVGLTVSWTRDILSTGMDPMDLPGPDSRLFYGYNIELIHCFWL